MTRSSAWLWLRVTGPASLALLIFWLSACADQNPGSSDKGQAERPNIIVIFTDDQGFADLGIQAQREDIQTPNIDNIARQGARMTQGYVTAPQCIPSRAAMITGRYQQRFGMDDNNSNPLPSTAITLGQRFTDLGYKTGMVGKWHLEVDRNSSQWLRQNHPELDLPGFSVEQLPLLERAQYFPNHRGYQDTYFGYRDQYWATFDVDGQTREESFIQNDGYRIDVISDAAVAFVERHWQEPFYLHVAHFAPHVPLEATQKYLDRFPGELPNRRRYALAMMSAIDDGVGRIMAALTRHQILENTLIFFISDNGAPLNMPLTDAPIDDPTELWNGSLNTPFVGEKGMLTDGGIRVPYLVQWPAKIPKGVVIDKPVSVLDVGYTALKAAGAKDLSGLDGVDLLPALGGDAAYLEGRPLYWRFWQQSAIRLGRWKYLRAGLQQEYLFDMDSPAVEKQNMLETYPQIAQKLAAELSQWAAELQRQDPPKMLNPQEQYFYRYYFPLDPIQ